MSLRSLTMTVNILGFDSCSLRLVVKGLGVRFERKKVAHGVNVIKKIDLKLIIIFITDAAKRHLTIYNK
ncbi:hypothetical protein ANSO36C_59930 [Nostoc cf. commune SO-36]|uniref:Uncharacterized protein n=1 Tax=Nostoc cf. commune SO-36 TaxID=449208 RepID=A0ABN6QAK4_NOSCO|nr:hypothetical protein ANSO36C_59930 [Nostoc cf. commune SO-36]